MSEAASQPSAKKDLSADLVEIEQQLQETVSATAIDFLGTSTRSFMDKTMLVAAIGILISTIGKMPEDATLGPFKITIAATWLIPFAVMFALLFYSVGLALLAKLDYSRWSAIYRIKSAKQIEIARSLLPLQVEIMEQFKRDGQKTELDVLAGKYVPAS